MTLPARLAAVLALILAGFAAFSFYESRYLGLFPLGEVPPKADLYHYLRSAFAALMSLLIVGTIQHSPREDPPGGQESPAVAAGAAWAVLAIALACTLMFWIDPVRFARGAEEDSAIEWLSALLLLGGSALFARIASVRAHDGAAAVPAALFALLFFVTGMEEISWLQRVIGFDTPPELARANMQGEFNLHNVHTDLSENMYYVGAAGFLIVLPLLREALPAARGRWGWVLDYVPTRRVAAVAAPLSIFNYGMWNVIPMQMSMMVTVLVAGCFARSACRQGSRSDAALFAAIAAIVIAGQAAFLARGHLLPNIWDASEYKELFIALGLFAFACEAAHVSGKRRVATALAAPARGRLARRQH